MNIEFSCEMGAGGANSYDDIFTLAAAGRGKVRTLPVRTNPELLLF